MFTFFKNKKFKRQAATRLYATIVAQARQPVFYQHYDVPDTQEGRFELICLHAYLVIACLQKEKSKIGRDLAQAVFDQMFLDMECSLRESGVGDLSVPKYVKRMMRGFNGRATAYHKALNKNDCGILQAALAKNLYAQAHPATDGFVCAMGRYTIENAAFLARQDLTDGNVVFVKMDKSDEETKRNECDAGMAA